MLKILQARLQQYMNRELSDVQTGFRKGSGTRDQIANNHWIIVKARECQKNVCCEVASVVSDSVRPHRRKPTRLPRPWDSIHVQKADNHTTATLLLLLDFSAKLSR